MKVTGAKTSFPYILTVSYDTEGGDYSAWASVDANAVSINGIAYRSIRISWKFRNGRWYQDNISLYRKDSFDPPTDKARSAIYDDAESMPKLITLEMCEQARQKAFNEAYVREKEKIERFQRELIQFKAKAEELGILFT